MYFHFFKAASTLFDTIVKLRDLGHPDYRSVIPEDDLPCTLQPLSVKKKV